MDERPLLELRSSKVRTGEYLRPNRLLLFGDRVEEFKPNLVRKHRDAIPLEQVAQVVVKNGLVWSELAIESTGGHTISVGGLSKFGAERARTIINAQIGRRRAETLGSPVLAATIPPQPDLLAQLSQLGELRDSGVLTSEEFEQQKGHLLAEHGGTPAPEAAVRAGEPGAPLAPPQSWPLPSREGRARDVASKATQGARERLAKMRNRGGDQSATAAGDSPAGWHPDPHGRHELRYWDGTVWTDHVADAGETSSDPVS